MEVEFFVPQIEWLLMTNYLTIFRFHTFLQFIKLKKKNTQFISTARFIIVNLSVHRAAVNSLSVRRPCSVIQLRHFFVFYIYYSFY